MKTTDVPVIIKHYFESSISDVWKAISELDQMKHWFFEQIPEFKAEVGFEVSFNVEAPSRDFFHLWRITEVIPNQKLSYNWKYADLKGDSFVTFELFTENNKTLLILSTKVIEDFDDTIPEFTRASCFNGWNYFIKDRLNTFLMNKK